MRTSFHAVATMIVIQLAIGGLDAKAEESRQISSISQAFRTGESVQRPITAARGAAHGSDFQLGLDGVVAPTVLKQPPSKKSDANSLEWKNNTKKIVRRNDTPFDLRLSTKENYSSSSSELRLSERACSPSPLVPADIATLVSKTAIRFGVDPEFARAIAWTESRFDQHRNSPKGARGPMQLIPEIAQRFGVADICDPAANIEGGMRYLRTLIDRFGNPLLVAAAYNAGEESVYQYHGVPPFTETVRYIADVINYQLSVDAPGRLSTHSARSNPPQVLDIPDAVNAPRTIRFVSGVMQF